MADNPPKETPQGKFTSFTSRKEEEPANVVASRAASPEDDFQPFYFTADNKSGVVIAPPYDPLALKELVQTNNTLQQCISAMEVNIDGTGFSVEKKGEEKSTAQDDLRIEALTSFFDEPYPRESFITQRRILRRDLEQIGYAGLEVIRNAQDSLVFVRPLEAHMLRLVKLDPPVPVQVTVERDGKEETITLMARERRFAQVVSNKLGYFKEYGATRDLNRHTGEWAPKGTRLPASSRATELIYFTVLVDKFTPYGVPRWINQTPSVVGSRRAEELNLDFFDTGGIPPVLVFVSGGQLDADSKKHLENLLVGKANTKQRGGVVEVQSTSGDLNSSGSVSVDVERFGSEKQNDSMFEAYDDKCEKRVRSSFRLPPLFVGKAEDYSYASVYASYTLAEAQVFKPERDEFDEIINVTLMRELDSSGDYRFTSAALSVNDADMQLKALGMAKDSMDDEGFVGAINTVVGTSIKVGAEGGTIREKTPKPQQVGVVAARSEPQAGDATPGQAPTRKEEVEKADPLELVELATDWAAMHGLDGRKKSFEASSIAAARQRITTLGKADRGLFDSMLASRTMVAVDLDYEGASELCGCAVDVLTHAKH